MFPNIPTFTTLYLLLSSQKPCADTFGASAPSSSLSHIPKLYPPINSFLFAASSFEALLFSNLLLLSAKSLCSIKITIFVIKQLRGKPSFRPCWYFAAVMPCLVWISTFTPIMPSALNSTTRPCSENPNIHKAANCTSRLMQSMNFSSSSVVNASYLPNSKTSSFATISTNVMCPKLIPSLYRLVMVLAAVLLFGTCPYNVWLLSPIWSKSHLVIMIVVKSHHNHCFWYRATHLLFHLNRY